MNFLSTKFNKIFIKNLYLNDNTLLLLLQLYCRWCVYYRRFVWQTVTHISHKLKSESDARKTIDRSGENIIVKEIAKGVTQESVPRKLDWYMRTVQRFFGKSCTKKNTKWQRCFEDGNCKGSTSTQVQFTQEAWEDY